MLQNKEAGARIHVSSSSYSYGQFSSNFIISDDSERGFLIRESNTFPKRNVNAYF